MAKAIYLLSVKKGLLNIKKIFFTKTKNLSFPLKNFAKKRFKQNCENL